MSSLVFPLHDPKNIETPFLQKITPILKQNFNRAFISLTPSTIANNPSCVEWLSTDDFFIVNTNHSDSAVGDHFLSAYQNAIKHSTTTDVLHLCTADRLAYSLLNYPSALADYKQAEQSINPTLFIRSAVAWDTHPQNYYIAESLITKMGEIIFHQTLDFAWCHLTLKSEQLNKILPLVKPYGFVVLAELAYLLRNTIKTREVDWLSWEDPFILNKDPIIYKAERENDPAEINKRLAYVVPMINYLYEKSITS